MYSEYRDEPKCRVCGKNRPTCGDPKIYCRACAMALQTGKPDQSNPGCISSRGAQYEPGMGEAVYDGAISRKGEHRRPLKRGRGKD